MHFFVTFGDSVVIRARYILVNGRMVVCTTNDQAHSCRESTDRLAHTWHDPHGNALPSFFVEGDDFATGCLVQPDLDLGAERD